MPQAVHSKLARANPLNPMSFTAQGLFGPDHLTKEQGCARSTAHLSHASFNLNDMPLTS